jgi:hypothetical protein
MEETAAARDSVWNDAVGMYNCNDANMQAWLSRKQD